MADFYPVLSRAIAALQDQTPEARNAIYDRARQVLLAQLRAMDPPVSEADITRQRLALNEVIARIEREQAALADQALFDGEPPLALTPQPPPATARPPAPRLEPVPAPPAPAEPAAVAAEPTPPAVDRPRLDYQQPTPQRRMPWGKLIVAGGVALAIGAIATTAYVVNRGGDGPSLVTPTPRPAPSAEGPKVTDRVGAESAPSSGAPSSPPPLAPTPGQPARQEPPGAPLAVAQRAVLYVEPTDMSQPPRAIIGRVVWRVEAENTGPGRPLETVIRADVDIPENGLQLIFTIRRNQDQAFPASHIVGMRFQRTSDDGNGAVLEAGVPQFKAEENERGAPLSAITSALGQNLFVSALSRVPVEVERNVELIRTRNWIDIPVRFASNRRGIIAFEKGLSGDQRIAEGFAAWR
jgi:hypothetical protein